MGEFSEDEMAAKLVKIAMAGRRVGALTINERDFKVQFAASRDSDAMSAVNMHVGWVNFATRENLTNPEAAGFELLRYRRLQELIRVLLARVEEAVQHKRRLKQGAVLERMLDGRHG